MNKEQLETEFSRLSDNQRASCELLFKKINEETQEPIIANDIVGQTRVAKYRVDFDDSSDEETEETNQTYDINIKWEEFKEGFLSDISDVEELKNHQLSFVAHALGMSLLYSQESSQIYRSLKRERLSLGDEQVKNLLNEMNDIFSGFIQPILVDQTFEGEESQE